MSYSIIIFCLLFAFLAWKNYKLALYLSIIFLPAYLIRFDAFGLPTTILETMIAILTIFGLIQYNKNFFKLTDKSFYWPIIAIIIFASLSVAMSPNTVGGLGIWKAYFIEPIIFFFILINTIKGKKDLHKLFWSLGVSAVGLSLIGFWQKFSGWNMPSAFLSADGSVDRIVSVFGYPNALGLYLGPIVILFSGFIQQKSNLLIRLLKLIVIVTCFVAIILAKSEAAILSILFIWLIWLVINKKTRLLSLIIIAVILSAIMLQPGICDYFSTKLLLQDYSGFIRRLIWQESWEMLEDNWLFGAGLAGYQVKIVPYHLPTFEIFLYPHNIFLNFWSELGLLGLLSFIGLVITAIIKIFKEIFRDNNEILYLTILMVLAQIFIHGLVDAPYLKNDLSVMFWTFIAVIIIGKKIKFAKT